MIRVYEAIDADVYAGQPVIVLAAGVPEFRSFCEQFRLTRTQARRVHYYHQLHGFNRGKTIIIVNHDRVRQHMDARLYHEIMIIIQEREFKVFEITL